MRSQPKPIGIIRESQMLDRLRRVYARSRTVESKSSFLGGRVRGKAVLDLGCVGHSASLSISQGDSWLHRVLSRNAQTCIGVDYLEEDIRQLQAAGWNVVCQDVTKLALGRRFDVVVLGDVLEHLTDFGGFFESAIRHLSPGGELVISTPNASGLVHSVYTALRG